MRSGQGTKITGTRNKDDMDKDKRWQEQGSKMTGTRNKDDRDKDQRWQGQGIAMIGTRIKDDNLSLTRTRHKMTATRIITREGWQRGLVVALYADRAVGIRGMCVHEKGRRGQQQDSLCTSFYSRCSWYLNTSVSIRRFDLFNQVERYQQDSVCTFSQIFLTSLGELQKYLFLSENNRRKFGNSEKTFGQIFSFQQK